MLFDGSCKRKRHAMACRERWMRQRSSAEEFRGCLNQRQEVPLKPNLLMSAERNRTARPRSVLSTLLGSDRPEEPTF